MNFSVVLHLHWSDSFKNDNQQAIRLKYHSPLEIICKSCHELKENSKCMQVLFTIFQRFWVVRRKASFQMIASKCLVYSCELSLLRYKQMALSPPQLIGFTRHFVHLGFDYYGLTCVGLVGVNEESGCFPTWTVQTKVTPDQSRLYIANSPFIV